MPATVRISDSGRALLGELATETQGSMTAVLDAALEMYRRHRFLVGVQEDYARLAADPAARADYQAELSALDGTVVDGLTTYQP
jgi:hypothetical protein